MAQTLASCANAG